MTVIFLLLLVGGFVCFLLATAQVPARISLLALGLALWILVDLIQKARQIN